MLTASATDSGHPALFEQAVRDVFEFLGYQAEWIGGSGKTDVLLDAVLGKDDTYRVIVDCKTSATGAVSDQQVDWTTLAEHKRKHEADYVALVAPKPSGARLFERAAQYSVVVLSLEQLAGLTRQHAKSPVGLDVFRSLFTVGGRAETITIDEQAEDLQRLAALGAAVYGAIRDRSTIFGRLTARDLYLILGDSPDADGTTEREIQSLLDTFASPLLGLLSGAAVEGYRVTTSADVAVRRINVMARSLSPETEDT
jgi:hypothetical protein